jgi:predicted ATPase
MKIKSLYFKNGYLGREVSRIEFQNLNLLVGVSGAGKSQIINALWLLRGIAVSGNWMNNVDWHLEFSIEDKQYEWKGSFGLTSFDANYKIKTESIKVSTGQKIERKQDGLIHIVDPNFGSPESTTRSTTPDGLLFQIYSSYDFIEEIVHHFKMMNIRDHTQSQANANTDFYRLRFRYDGRRVNTNLSLEALQNSNYNVAERLLIAFKKRGEDFTVYDDILAEVKSIFPEIDDWSVEEQVSRNNEDFNVAYKIRISGQRSFIQHKNIASGMLRTFNIIADIYLSNIETVFLLDEFENSLGHNCLPSLEELILDRSVNSQFIITSHHPDIINKIPKDNWIIIERDNGHITNRTASEIGFGNSFHEPYLILTNHFDSL